VAKDPANLAELGATEPAKMFPNSPGSDSLVRKNTVDPLVEESAPQPRRISRIRLAQEHDRPRRNGFELPRTEERREFRRRQTIRLRVRHDRAESGYPAMPPNDAADDPGGQEANGSAEARLTPAGKFV